MKIKFKVQTLNKATASKQDILLLPLVASEEKSKASKSESKKQGRSGSVQQRFNASSRKRIEEIESFFSLPVFAEIERQEYFPALGKKMEVYTASTPRIVRLFALRSLSGEHLDDWRRYAADALSSAKNSKSRNVGLVLDGVEKQHYDDVVQAIVEGAILSNYSYTAYKSAPGKSEKEEISFNILVAEGEQSISEKALRIGQIVAEATCFARDLVNTPPSDLLPDDVARVAKSLKSSRVSVKVFSASELKKMKAFALLAVGRASESQPCLIHLHYRARGAKSKPPITIIGKGVTFDSGGLSLKPGKGMEDMKCDMAGAACVMAVIKALSQLDSLERDVHALVPCAENMVSGNALRPGDVIRAMNGKSIEVLNTDAEGRLILADALSYAERLNSRAIVDLATLTGACIVALGSEYAGMFSNDETLAAQLKEQGLKCGELLWPLPLAEEYSSEMKSDVADLKNIGTGGPGAILGALFLKEFVPVNVPWVHLDIAGPAFGVKGNEYTKKGGTGFGVRTLLSWLHSIT